VSTIDNTSQEAPVRSEAFVDPAAHQIHLKRKGGPFGKRRENPNEPPGFFILDIINTRASGAVTPDALP